MREDILTTELQKVSSESQRRELYSMDWLDDKDKIIEGAFAECYLKNASYDLYSWDFIYN